MVYQYRVLKQDISSGLVEASYYTSLRDAYRACLPDKNTHCCHLMLNGLEQSLKEGNELIRVTCYATVVYWLEHLLQKIDPLAIPVLPSKIDCCHPLN
jgi:hypothetical protein